MRKPVKFALMIGSLRMLGFIPAVITADEDLLECGRVDLALGVAPGDVAQVADTASHSNGRQTELQIRQEADSGAIWCSRLVHGAGDEDLPGNELLGRCEGSVLT